MEMMDGMTSLVMNTNTNENFERLFPVEREVRNFSYRRIGTYVFGYFNGSRMQMEAVDFCGGTY